MSQRKPPFVVYFTALALGALASSGCGLFRTVTKVPGDVASAVSGKEEKPPPPSLDVVSAKLMRFADVFALDITRATTEFARRANSKEAEAQSLRWQIDYCDYAWRLASAPQPYEGLFDTIVLVSALHRAHETVHREHWGDADQPMIDSLAQLTASAWALAESSLTKEQVADTRAVIEKWLAADNPDRGTDLTHLPSFGKLVSEDEQKSGTLGGLFSIDPLGGLEPAVKEVAQARQLGERAVYYFQRMPELLAARVALLTITTLREPAVHSAVESVDRVSRAADSIAATAEKLPAQVSAEREAAIAQVSAVIDAQRAGLMKDLETGGPPLNEVLGNTHRVLESGTTLSQSLTETVKAVDAFLAREAAESAKEDAVPKPPSEPARPFDITEYGAAAERFTALARELQATVQAIDTQLPAVERVVDTAAVKGQQTVDHVFVRALQWLLAALVGGALAVLAVRRISSRWRTA
jgi:hypothetical protein